MPMNRMKSLFPARAERSPAELGRFPDRAEVEPHRTMAERRPLLTMPAVRYLALLFLLTPVLGVVQLLLSRAVPPPPQVVTEVVEVPQIVEVPRNVYIEVPVPTIVVVDVPVERVVAVGPPAEAASTEAPAAVSEASEAAPDVAEAPDAAPEVAEAPEAPPPVAPVRPVAARALPRPAPAPAAEPEVVTESPPEQPAVAEAEAPVEETVAAEPGANAGSVPVSPANRSLADFYGYTEKNWSIQGYSSVEQMREALGNSKTGWLKQTEAQVRAEESAAGSDGK